jgi:hypothetical protein
MLVAVEVGGKPAVSPVCWFTATQSDAGKKRRLGAKVSPK